VPGAEVGLVGAAAIERHVTADAAGAWKLEAKTGRWGLSAATATATGFIDSAKYDKDTANIKLAVASGVKVRGKLTTKPVADTYVTVSVTSQHDSDLFVVRVAEDGTFATQVPRSRTVTVQMLEHAIGQASKEITGDEVEIEVSSAVLAPPEQAVVDWTAAHAFPIATVEAGHGFDDLAPFAKLIGNAHVIALGEATHGTREFFQIKHRMLEYLVTKLGVTTFAIEANQPECRTIDDYVVNGKGDATTALAGIYFWTWNTEEVLAMIEWMRAYNADPKHAAKIHFTGYDMQTSHVAHANVITYLNEVGADATLAAPIAPLGDKMSAETIAKLDAGAQGKIAAGLTAVAKAFDANKAAWRAKRTSTAFDDARHDVTVLQQAFAMYTAKDNGSFDVRDQSMADNIDWLRKQGPPSLRIMVWAHNGHVANKLAAFKNMGGILRKRYARDYVNIGFVFGDGGFQAIDSSKSAPGAMGTLGPITVGPPAATNGSAPFDHNGKPLLALDLHAVPAKGPVHDWFGQQHPYREIGAVYFSEQTMLAPMALTELYDAVIYVAHTTHAQPITGFKRRGT
jgi:erythromycin esterase